jgi:hypothetical protein
MLPLYKVQDSNLLALRDFYITITIRKEVVKSKLPYALFEEVRNKILISEPAELFLSPIKVQYWTAVRIEDY